MKIIKNRNESVTDLVFKFKVRFSSKREPNDKYSIAEILCYRMIQKEECDKTIKKKYDELMYEVSYHMKAIAQNKEIIANTSSDLQKKKIELSVFEKLNDEKLREIDLEEQFGESDKKSESKNDKYLKRLRGECDEIENKIIQLKDDIIDKEKEIQEYRESLNKRTKNDIDYYHKCMDFIWDYIEFALEKSYTDFIQNNNLSKKEFPKPIISNKEETDGSLILTFNLIVKTALNLVAVYRFVERIVEWIYDLNDDNLDCTISAIPAMTQNLIVNQTNGVFERFTITGLVFLGLLTCGNIVYTIITDNKIDKLPQTSIQETEQIVKEEVQNAIYREKVDYIFNHSGAVPIAAQSDSTKVKQK